MTKFYKKRSVFFQNSLHFDPKFETAVTWSQAISELHQLVLLLNIHSHGTRATPTGSAFFNPASHLLAWSMTWPRLPSPRGLARPKFPLKGYQRGGVTTALFNILISQVLVLPGTPGDRSFFSLSLSYLYETEIWFARCKLIHNSNLKLEERISGGNEDWSLG